MSWKKILFLCLSLVFVFTFAYQKTNIVHAANYVAQVSEGKIIGYKTDTSSWITGEGSGATVMRYHSTSNGNIYYLAMSDFGDFKSGNLYSIPEGSTLPLKASDSSLKSVFANNVTATRTQYEEQNAESTATGQQEQQRLSQKRQEERAAEAAKQNGAKIECSVGDWLNLYCWAAKFSNEVILTAAGLISGVAGYLFDSVINFSVIEMGKNVKIGNGDYLSNAWKIMRDVVNIAFIFVLLYIGIMTIIKGFESGTSKMIATVIVVALIINFSLFFTKIIIDTSNIIAVNFYQTIQTQTKSSTSEWSGVAGAFLNVLQLGTINKDVLKQQETNGSDMFLNIIKISLGGTVILIILALILLIASLMFITRYVVLILVLVTSAAAIGSWILPSLKKSIYDKWWGALIGQSFFAPVFLFFLFLSLKMTEGLTESLLKDSGNMSWSQIFLGSPAPAINLIISYFVVVAFLVGSIIVSKQLSNMAGSGAGKITGFMGGAALGATAWGLRRGGGALGAKWNSEEMQEKARNAKGFAKAGLLAQNFIGAKAKKGSFDLRNATGAGALLGAGGISAKDGWAANKGGAVADDKKWLEFKEGIRGTYSAAELKAKGDAAVKRDIEKNKDGAIATAKKAYDAENAAMKKLEEEEKNQRAALGKSTNKTEQEKIQKRLEEIEKLKTTQKANITKAADAQKEAEESVRKKELAKYKASKSNKDKAIEAMKKLAEEDEKKTDKPDETKKPDKPKS